MNLTEGIVQVLRHNTRGGGVQSKKKDDADAWYHPVVAKKLSTKLDLKSVKKCADVILERSLFLISI